MLYFDTDSVIYSKEPGQSELPIGDFLGDLTNEVDPGRSHYRLYVGWTEKLWVQDGFWQGGMQGEGILAGECSRSRPTQLRTFETECAGGIGRIRKRGVAVSLSPTRTSLRSDATLPRD